MKMSVAALVLLAAVVSLPPAAHAALTLPRLSPKAGVAQSIGTTDLAVTYCRPGVKGRVIWGGLVPYDKVWRTGANEATTFSCSDSIRFGGSGLPAGKYALFTIPSESDWTIILNSVSDQWGAFSYDSTKDVLRLKVRPTKAEPEERMRFSFEDLTPTSANLVLRWEKLRVAVPITVDVNAQVLAGIHKALGGLERDAWRTPYQAASFCLTNDVSLEQGRKWLDQSLAADQNYTNLSLLARWQMKQGKKAEAIASAKRAIAAGKASKRKVNTSETEKLLEEWQSGK